MNYYEKYFKGKNGVQACEALHNASDCELKEMESEFYNMATLSRELSYLHMHEFVCDEIELRKN